LILIIIMKLILFQIKSLNNNYLIFHNFPNNFPNNFHNIYHQNSKEIMNNKQNKYSKYNNKKNFKSIKNNRNYNYNNKKNYKRNNKLTNKNYKILLIIKI